MLHPVRAFAEDPRAPGLLYAAGDAVEDLVRSGVSDYLEFKSLRGLYLLMEEEGRSSAARGAPTCASSMP